MTVLTPVKFENVDINDGFWGDRQKLNREVSIYSVMDRFEQSGRFKAFEFGWREGSEEAKPHYFWDSDIAKWIESAAYIITKKPDEILIAKIEKVIDLIEKNQCEDGYFNIYHSVVEPELRFKNRDHHELYCLGHLIEAAIAYYNACADDRFIRILDRYIDCVIKAFVTEKTAEFVTPGHEEIELALIRLYELKGDKKYLDLAMFFLNKRGQNEEEGYRWGNQKHAQSHLPVREQTTAEGHSVRACYLYTGMAMAAKHSGDAQLLSACKAVFDDIVNKKMYISGGIGSSHIGEAFTTAYDLPNDTAYAETCASIALYMFANAMKDIDFDSRYADIAELEMYNGIISGISLDGKAFFYENPLEINLADRTRHTSAGRGERLPITQRKELFDCSCCPPNLTRFAASVGGSVFSLSDSGDIFIHQFMSCNATADGAEISIETQYPADGKVQVSVSSEKSRKLYIRIPAWCKTFNFSHSFTIVNNYACIEVAGGIDFSFTADFEMKPVFVAASSHVRADAGKTALMYGPLLYCLEKKDNPFELFNIELDTEAELKLEYDAYFGANVIYAQALVRTDSSERLYCTLNKIEKEKKELKFIPYYAFANRGESDMRVWLRRV